MNPLVASDVAVEAATADDLERIVGIAQASFANPWTRKMFEAELSGNPFSSLVTARRRDGGERADSSPILGYLCYWIVFEELRLMDLAVDPKARRRGVARILVTHAMNAAGASGAVRAVLEVRASNRPAQALYDQFGFRCVTQRTNYYTHPTEDAILMELSPLAPLLREDRGSAQFHRGGDAC